MIYKEKVTDAELGQLYSCCSALVIGSEDEGFCLPAQEACAFGKPVIAPDISAIRESTAEQAYFYMPGDHQMLVNLISKIMDSSFFLEVEPNIKRIDYKQEWDAIELKWWNLIKETVNNG